MNIRHALVLVFKLIITAMALSVAFHCLSIYSSNTNMDKNHSTKRCTSTSDDQLMTNIVKIRNRMSRKMNEMSKYLGRLQCQKSGSQINEQGGWCKDVSKENSAQHKTDHILVRELSKYLKGKRVASFGDGPGAYKREILKLNEVLSYDAYDGAPFCEETSEGRVKFMDLTIPQYGIPLYDWILSLEVAEHIPMKFESVYLDNIFRHAKDGIILSWAVPGQNGLSHINNRPLDYVTNVMKENGFLRNEKMSRKLLKSSSFWWFQKNVNVYLRQNYPMNYNETILTRWLL